MKIRKIEIIRLSLPFTIGAPHLLSGSNLKGKPWTSMESLIVRIETDDGLFGWGECFGHMINTATMTILRDLIAPWFIGRSTNSIVQLMEEAEKAFHGFGRSGPVLYALSGIDIALWDLAAKRERKPLYSLLGGSKVTLYRYASLMLYGGDRDAIISNCIRAEEYGYRMIKLHERTLPAFQAARNAVDRKIDISIDVNCPWTVTEARKMAREISNDGFLWLEEPVWPPENFTGLAKVRNEGVPIAAGENMSSIYEFEGAFASGAIDVVQPSVCKVGGVTKMMRIIELANLYGIQVVPHVFYWGPGYLASAHIAATFPKPPFIETAFIDIETKPYPLFDPHLAKLNLPDEPGLGFEADETVLNSLMISKEYIVH